MSEEEVKAPLPEDKPEHKMFNEDARSAIEEAFDAFQAAPEPVEEPAPSVPEDKPSEPVEEREPVTTVTDEAEPTQFRTIEDAEKSYRNARLKMQEATERAKKVERENEELRRATAEALANLQTRAEQPPPSPPAPKAPPFTREELEAKFFEDPVGFMFSMQEAAQKAAIAEVESRTKEQRAQERKQAALVSFTNTTQKYFDDTYADLKPVEPLVTEEIKQVWNDPTFIRPIMEDKGKHIVDKAKAVVDEATRRLRSRLPDIGKSLGFSTPGEPVTERLTRGAPPLVPGGPSGPTTGRATDSTVTETPAEYMRERLQQHERTMTGVGRWRR